MLDRPRPRRSPARFLAPLVLVIAILATYLVIEHAVGGGSRPGGRSHAVHHAKVRRRTGVRSHVTTKPRYYSVKPGDSLSVISAHTGVPLPTLETLNPHAASGALQVGERLRLR